MRREHASLRWRDIRPLIDRRILLLLCFAVGAALAMAGIEALFASCIRRLMLLLGMFGSPAVVSETEWTESQVLLAILSLGVVRGVILTSTLSIPYAIEYRILGRLRDGELRRLTIAKGPLNGAVAESASLILETFAKAGRCAFFLTNLIASGCVCAGLLAAMFFVNTTFSLVALCGAMVIGLVVWTASRRLKAASRSQLTPLVELSEGVQRVTSNWLLMRAMRTERREYDSLATANDKLARSATIGAALGLSSATISAVFGIFLLVGLIKLRSMYSETSGPVFISLVYLLIRTVQTLTTMSTNLGQLSAFQPFLRTSLTRHLENGRLSTPRVDDSPSEAGRLEESPGVVVRDLRFRYAGSERLVVNGVSFVLPPRGFLGVIGPSGCGKSTLVSLLLGVQRPLAGEVLIDGIASGDFCDRWSDAIGYVGTDPHLFRGSIRENLVYGNRRTVSADDFEQALKMADAHEMIRRRSGGLDDPLFDAGSSLSSGEKQRLALARALLRQPRLLFLDEVTANLDRRAEQEITRTIGRLKGHCTMIVVSHRHEVLSAADVVLELPAPDSGLDAAIRRHA